MPAFSIIIPTYDRAYILARPIDSIRAQNITDWEILIVDDGGNDDTMGLIDAYSDPRIRYIRQTNAGASAARNTGMRHANGQIFVYLDSDDMFYPGYLEALTQTHGRYGICRHRRTIVFLNPDGTIASEKDDANNQNGAVTLQDFYDWRVKTTSSGLFHHRGARAVWRDVLIEDLDFILQLGAADPDGFAYIPGTFVDYRHVYGGDGICAHAAYADYARAFGQIYDWHKGDALMKNPDVYLSRVKSYTEKQARVNAGLEPPPQYKYFPELWTPAP